MTSKPSLNLSRRNLVVHGAVGASAFLASQKMSFADDKTAVASPVDTQPAPVVIEKAAPYSLPDLACFRDLKFETVAKWGVSVCLDTKQAVWEKNADVRMAPSSMTKMMTAYVVFQKIKAGQITLDTKVTISRTAWKTGGSRMFLPLGDTVSVDDLLKGLLCVSGNDAAMALAEGVGPSYDEFITAMNEWAQELGLDNSHFVNPTGLPAADHYMSSRNIAELGCHLITDFPEYYHYFSMKEFTFNKIKQGNRNTLILKGAADGLKTGHTDAGGFGLCATRTEDGRRFVCVLNGMPSISLRSTEMERLLDWSFREFAYFNLAKANEAVTPSLEVVNGENPVLLMTPADLREMLPVALTGQVTRKLVYPSSLTAPVVAGKTYGQAIWNYKGQVVAAQDLVAQSGSIELGIIGRIKRRLGLQK